MVGWDGFLSEVYLNRQSPGFFSLSGVESQIIQT